MGDLIDVVMLTRNSNRPYFHRVLKSIERNIPLNHLIIVDGYSTDGTIETVKSIFKEKTIVLRSKTACHGELGYARYLGMRLVDTEWFAFIDSDTEILDGWFENARRYMRLDRVWGIQGSFTGVKDLPLLIKRPNEIPQGWIIRDGFYRYMGASTANVLLRKKVISLLDPAVMTRLRSGEDFYIAHQIVKHGFLYLRVPEMKAIHHDTGLSLRGIIKHFRRGLSESGMFLEIPLSTYILYNTLHLLLDTHRNPLQATIRVFSILGSVASWIKTRKLAKPT